MSQFLEFAILGLASGSLYVLLALGVVIVHRGSGVVNFSHGAIGMFGTYVFWELNQRHHVAYAPSFILGVAVCAGLGLCIHYGAMRPLRSSALLTRAIATLAVLTILEQAAVRLFPTAPIVVPSELNIKPVKILGASVGRDRLVILGIVVVLSLILTIVYRRAQFGRATLAAAENRRAIAALGYSPDRIAAVNWVVGGALAGIAGILLAPITNLQITGYTLLIVPALAAAIIGGLASFPLTLVGGLLIGVLQAEIGRYVTSQGWSEAAPFFVIIVVLVIRGSDRTLRTSLAQRLPRLGSGRINLRVVLPAVAIALLATHFLSANWNDALTTTVGTALVLLSLVVVTGYSGQLSLAQFAFAGWGAWVAGLLASNAGFPFPLAVIIGTAAALPLGLVLGVVCLRTRGVNLAIATLGLAVALENLVFNNPAYTDSGQVNVPQTKLGPLDVGDIVHPNRYAVMVIICFVVCALCVANVRRGRTGRRMLAVRANERAAASLGIGVTGAKLAAFGLSSVIAALGGCLLAFRDPSIVYSNFSSLESIQLVAQAVVGGIGWVGGSLYGGLLQVGSLTSHVFDLLGAGVSDYLPLAGGVLLLVVLLTAPDGLALQAWLQHGAVRRLVGRPRRSAPAPAVPDLPARRVQGKVLKVSGLSVHFGGVVALSSVSLEVRPGEVVGLIGPNGAGKTTLIDSVTGYVSRASGAITLAGESIAGQAPTAIARRGLTRSFQSVELFDDMTVLDNLRAASDSRSLLSYVSDLVRPKVEEMSPTTAAAIREFGLTSSLSLTPPELPYGKRRLVGIARAVATEASVLLLDEPAAGLDDAETAELGDLIRHLADDWGMGILLIEHDVELVFRLCDRVHVLNFGQEVASGEPSAIRRDQKVIEAYLGSETAAAPAYEGGPVDETSPVR